MRLFEKFFSPKKSLIKTVDIKMQVRNARLFVDYAMAQPSATDIEPACKIIGGLSDKLEEIMGGSK